MTCKSEIIGKEKYSNAHHEKSTANYFPQVNKGILNFLKCTGETSTLTAMMDTEQPPVRLPCQVQAHTN